MVKAQLPLSLWCYEFSYVVGGPGHPTPTACGWCGESFGFRERIVWNGVEGSPAYHGTNEPLAECCYSTVANRMDQEDQKGGVPLPVSKLQYVQLPYDCCELIEPPYCGWCGRVLEDGELVRVRPLGLLQSHRWFEPGYADSRLYHPDRCFEEAAEEGAEPCAATN
jgi:hypothetical protein